MRKRFLAIATLAAAVGLSGAAVAQDTGVPDFDLDTASDLQFLCSSLGSSEEAITHRSFCYGYLSGSGHFYRALMEYKDDEITPFVCPGREVTREEAVKIFLDWASANPAEMNQAPVDALFKAWAEEFPCS